LAFACVAVAASMLLATGAWAATITTPSSNPFTVPGDAFGNPQSFTIVASGYPEGSSSVSVEVCDGVSAGTPGWTPLDHCDPTTSPAAVDVGANGIATFPANDGNFGFFPFKGLSPAGKFNCLAPSDPSPNNGKPDFTNCQARISTDDLNVTSDQVFLTMTLPATPAAPVDNPPVVHDMTVSLGVGGTKTITLNATDTGDTVTPPTPVTGCSITTPPSAARLQATVSNSPTPCQATLTDTGTGAASVTFQFNATDGVAPSATSATVTVSIGTAPVDQPINQLVNPGALTLSCSAPGSPGYPALSCPLITLPPVQLDGTQHTSTSPANPIYVSDSRGDATVGWSLTSYMVTTPSNPNTGCAAATDFCNSTVSVAQAANPNAHIPSSDLALSAITCTPSAGNSNPNPTAGAGGSYGPPSPALALCSAAAGSSGGTFSANGTFTLTVPASVFSGLYMGTVEYLVS
jgi:hypothetical protein